MSELPDKLYLTAKDVQVWVEYLEALEYQDKELLDEGSQLEKELQMARKGSLRGRRWNTLSLILLLVILGAAAIVIGVNSPVDRTADILINFGSGVVGTAVTFIYIRFWQNTENNFKHLNRMLKGSQRNSETIKKLQIETAELKQKAKTLFKDIDSENPNRERFKAFLEHMVAHVNHVDEMYSIRIENTLAAADLVDELEANTFIDQRRFDRLKASLQAKADEYRTIANESRDDFKEVDYILKRH